MAAVSELPYLSVQSPWRRRAKSMLGLQASLDEAPAAAFPSGSPALAGMEMPMGDGGAAAPALVDGIDYRAIGLPRIQDFWMRKAADGQDWKALARAYWDSHPELEAAGYGDWNPHQW